MSSDHLQRVIDAIRSAGGDGVPASIDPLDSLVLALGFDSMKMAMLSLSLESEFGCPITLDQWIASHPDPHDLTVGSLCDYMQSVFDGVRAPDSK